MVAELLERLCGKDGPCWGSGGLGVPSGRPWSTLPGEGHSQGLLFVKRVVKGLLLVIVMIIVVRRVMICTV